MADTREQSAQASTRSKHESYMERFRSLELTLSDQGVPSLTTNQARQLYAYGLYETKRAPKHFENWQQVEQGIELIQGMGTPALANLRYVYFVGGHLTAMHKLCLAACQATGELEHYEYIHVNAKNERLSEENLIGFVAAGCIVYARRKGYEKAAMGTFTMEQATAAGLAQRNQNYKNYTNDMLWHRASMRALYAQFSDVLQGVRCKEDEEMHLLLDGEGQPVTTPRGDQIFQRRAGAQQRGAEAYERLKQET